MFDLFMTFQYLALKISRKVFEEVGYLLYRRRNKHTFFFKDCLHYQS